MTDRPSSNGLTACECQFAGWCNRHQVVKNQAMVNLCQRHEGYWNAWENGNGPRQQFNTAATIINKSICTHRGKKLATIENCKCSGNSNVFHCNLLNRPCMKSSTVKTIGDMKITYEEGVDPFQEKPISCSTCKDFKSAEAVIEKKTWQLKADFERVSQPPIEELYAVTALSALPKHQERQPLCLDSWKRTGLYIIAVNTEEEIEKLQPLYPQVDEWIVNNNLSQEYERPTQHITNLTDIAVIKTHPIMLINSDIEIVGNQDRLIEATKDPNRITVGIRWNYTGKKKLGEREQWGFDAFIMSPEAALTLPRLKYGIGKPMWDYWLPYHFREFGFVLDFIGDRYFYHERHPLHWSQAEWYMGSKWLCEYYKIGRFNIFDSVEFRATFPYGQNHNDKEPVPPPPVIETIPTYEGPGTELKRILSWMFTDTAKCKCQERARLMDLWGPDGCRNNMETILIWMKEGAEIFGVPYSQIVAKAVVHRAIATAEKKLRLQPSRLTAFDKLKLRKP